MLVDMLVSTNSFVFNGDVPFCDKDINRLFHCQDRMATMFAVEEGKPGSRGLLVAWNRLYFARASELSE